MNFGVTHLVKITAFMILCVNNLHVVIAQDNNDAPLTFNSIEDNCEDWCQHLKDDICVKLPRYRRLCLLYLENECCNPENENKRICDSVEGKAEYYLYGKEADTNIDLKKRCTIITIAP
jgi:hypothetical protein